MTKPNIYPIQPESFLDEIENFPAVELSFEMIYNSIISLQDWCFSSKSSNAEKGKVIKKYLQAIGFSSQLIQPLSEDLIGGKEASESLGFPSIGLTNQAIMQQSSYMIFIKMYQSQKISHWIRG